MTADQVIATIAAVCGICGPVATFMFFVSKFSRMELKVDELWEYRRDLVALQMRRGASEVAMRGMGQANSPFQISDRCKTWFDPISVELRAWYENLPDRQLSDVDLFMQLDKAFGNRLLKEIFIPHRLSQTEGMLCAACIAKDDPYIHLPEDTELPKE